MNYRDLFEIKTALEALHQIEQSFGEALALNKIYGRVIEALKPWDDTAKAIKERMDKLPEDAKEEREKITKEIEEAFSHPCDVDFQGLALRAENWFEKRVTGKILFPLFHHGLIKETTPTGTPAA